MSRPWMPLYVADYLADTSHLRAAQSGAYLHLIMHYWQKGGLPTDDGQLAAIARMTDKEWKSSREIIAAFFQDGWRHPRIEHELIEARAAYERRASAGKLGGMAKASGQHSPSNASSIATAKNEALLKQSQSQDLSSLRSDKSAHDEVFDRLRLAYPKRSGSDPRKPALAKFQAAVKRGADPEAIIAGARAYARFMAGNPKFVKQLANWITAECWTEDWDAKPRAREGPRSSSSDTHGFHDFLNGQRHEPDYHSDQIEGPGAGFTCLEQDYRGLSRQADKAGRGAILDLKPSDAG